MAVVGVVMRDQPPLRQRPGRFQGAGVIRTSQPGLRDRQQRLKGVFILPGLALDPGQHRFMRVGHAARPQPLPPLFAVALVGLAAKGEVSRRLARRGSGPFAGGGPVAPVLQPDDGRRARVRHRRRPRRLRAATAGARPATAGV